MSGPADGYRAAAGTAQAELREKGSRFLALVQPAADERAARDLLAAFAAEHADATHHCWAWRIAYPPAERSADAGEPAGTAGMPILQVLRGAEVSDVVAVVARWYGGTKLGKGGLARAYAGAVRAAVEALPVRLEVPVETLVVEMPYDRLGAVKRLLRPPAVELRGESYGAAVRLTVVLHRTERAGFEAALADLGLATHEPGAAGGAGERGA